MEDPVRPAPVSDILKPLTDPQSQAVRHVDGPLLILAGAGSGKTRVVIHRIAYLISQGIAPRNILALTFTNKAAEEMTLRLERLVPRHAVWMGTFHRFCARLLRIHASLVGLAENFSICDTEDSRKLLKETLREASISLTHFTPDQIMREISAAKNSLVTAAEYQPEQGRLLGSIVAEVYPEYQQRLLAANAVDFDDLLLHVATMLRENPELRSTLDAKYRYIAVDEYQDTNFAQYAIVRGLSQDYANLAVTGDPDQSIYGWRGANLNNILDFEQDFPGVKVVRLEQNYRSTRRILRVADQLIGHNVRRKEKSLTTQNPEGKPVCFQVYPSCRDEADHIALRIADEMHRGNRRARDFAVFYRVNSLSRSVESAMRNHGIPYQIVRGLEFYQRKEIKDVLAYLHLINNPRNDVALQRIINVPPRKIGKTTVNRLIDHARRYKQSLLDAAREAGLVETINKRAAANVAAFVAAYDQICLRAADPVQEIVSQVLQKTGYAEWLQASDENDEEERLANVHELLNDAREFDSQYHGDAPLESFLEEKVLVNDADGWEQETDRVSLMTLHAAKGLEFPVVFIVAAEQQFMPHSRSHDDPDQLEEERRLLFVGITRAEEELQISMAGYRLIQGTRRMMVPSSFLLELPREEMDFHQPPHFHETNPYDQTEEEIFSAEPVELDTAIDLGEPEAVGSILEESAPQGQAAPILKTAAAMLGTADAREHPDPDAFELGMIIQHPEDGLGKIVSISGAGAKRTATVRFVTQQRPKRIVLIHSKLQLVRSDVP